MERSQEEKGKTKSHLIRTLSPGVYLLSPALFSHISTRILSLHHTITSLPHRAFILFFTQSLYLLSLFFSLAAQRAALLMNSSFLVALIISALFSADFELSLIPLETRRRSKTNPPSGCWQFLITRR